MLTAPNLDNEVKVFEGSQQQLLSEGHAGKFAVVGEGALAGVWDTYEDALQAGYGKFGLAKPFLVKRIEGIDNLHFFTRDISCPA
jgi:hypothetical protein